MYGKHFASVYSGSMVGAGLNVFAVWGYVIANTVKSRVELNPKLLAMLLGCTEQEIQLAIEYLTSPDPDSRHREHDGKRLIKEGQHQYFVPSHETYRKILNEDERREYNRVMQAKHRARKAAETENKEACQDVKEDVIDMSALSAHTDTEAEALKSIVDSWNVLAEKHGLSKVCKLTDKRRKHLRARLGDKDWVAAWEQALALVPDSPFLLGKSDRGWKADFDWFIKPDSVMNIIEGKYQGGPPRPEPTQKKGCDLSTPEGRAEYAEKTGVKVLPPDYKPE